MQKKKNHCGETDPGREKVEIISVPCVHVWLSDCVLILFYFSLWFGIILSFHNYL